MQSDGLTYSATSACDGTSSTVITNRYCLVPMATLRASPYNLVLNSLVVSKITATNIYGTSPFSLPNTSGMTIKTEPKTPPTTVYGGPNTLYHEIHILWDPLTGDDAG